MLKRRGLGPGSLTAAEIFSFLSLRLRFQIPTIKKIISSRIWLGISRTFSFLGQWWKACRLSPQWKQEDFFYFILMELDFFSGVLFVCLFIYCCLFMILLLISRWSTLALGRWKPSKTKNILQVAIGKVKPPNLEAPAGRTSETPRLTHWKVPKIYKRWNENMTQWISQWLLLNKTAGFRVNQFSHPWTLTGCGKTVSFA